MTARRFVAVALLMLAACQAPVATPEPEARTPRQPTPPARIEISETPCRQAVGEAASARLVRRCITVSPATRPPCHADNPCDLIQGEIDRACAMLEPGRKPAECAG
jgi:hypothetical protein